MEAKKTIHRVHGALHVLLLFAAAAAAESSSSSSASSSPSIPFRASPGYGPHGRAPTGWCWHRIGRGGSDSGGASFSTTTKLKRRRKIGSQPSAEMTPKSDSDSNPRTSASDRDDEDEDDDDDDEEEEGAEREDPFLLLAEALRPRLIAASEDDGDAPSSDCGADAIVRSFRSLSSAQQAFKGLDGAAHEAYQRTHPTTAGHPSATSTSSSSASSGLASVSGRATRSAARAGAVADGLGACELCELVESPETQGGDNNNGTALEGRQVLVNETVAVPIRGNQGRTVAGEGTATVRFRVLLLYEPNYRGGAGVEHGGMGHNGGRRRADGRLVVVVGDSECRRLGTTIQALASSPPVHVRVSAGPGGRGGAGSDGEAGSVQPILYRAAASVLELVEEPLRAHNASAIHLVGRSLAGGVASLAGAILEGPVPMPAKRDAKKKKKSKMIPKADSASSDVVTSSAEGDEPASAVQRNATEASTDERPPLQGLGAGRTSVLALGAPPCLSPNVPADYITSIVYGDDVVCRASPAALDRLVDRTRRNLQHRGLGGLGIGRSFHWVSDAVSLAATNLRTHAHGSEGEEARLAVPGRAYLVRPRRLGGACSMHEIGSHVKGGREALRAAVLWQLNDVLLSRSMWRHHQLESYIHGLDRVQLRGLDGESE